MVPTETAEPLLPEPNELTRSFWAGAREHRLVIQRCASCQTYQHPPEPICHHCLSFDLSYQAVSGQARVYSCEVATQAFHPYFQDKLPFSIAVVELAEQPDLRLVTNIVDIPPEEVRVGLPVRVAFRLLSADIELPVFVPAEI
jgi:uncharacterized OB-fold protein